jgi:predicted deacylase
MKRQRKVPRDGRRQVVKELAAAGLSGDVIAATLKLGKNRLRAEHALDLHSGRTARKADEAVKAAAAPTKEEAERLKIIKQAFKSHWYTEEHGCDLFNGARTVQEALAYWASFRPAAREPEEDSDEPDA